ncbi:MAG: methylenetetrahydrofolate reductase, partial [Oscillibacter sp.]|nr:methylenetetrahydrofolate reductase [Oscillibacter sp.]
SLDASAVRVSDREPPAHSPGPDPFGEKLEAGERVIAIELDPPADDDGGYFLEGARRLRDAGADIVTIADCPVGRARADSSLMACMLRREGVEPLPHMTCRDRNLNAVKALLLGLSMGEVRNILLVTGDPIPSESRDEIKSVFNFNSRKLARYIRGLHGSALRTPFRIFGALNINARNFDAQLFSAKEKEASGMAGFLTQPVLSPEAQDNLKLAREALQGKILGGIFPVVSYKNAVFLNNEVAGIRVSEEMIARYEGKSREEGEDLAVELSLRTAEEIGPWTDGLYLVTPFRRVALMERILGELARQVEQSRERQR